MILTHLELRNFRSYKSASLSFSEGCNAIVGKNGSGKTNLVEAIYLLSLCKSWRNNDSRTLIRSGEQNAFLYAKIHEGETTRSIEILLTSKGKKILVNGKSISKLSELSKILNIVLFTPEDVDLFKDSPSLRRNFLDVSISKENQQYLLLMSEYTSILKERNTALKAKNVDESYVDVLTERLIDLSEPIIEFRNEYIKRLNDVLSDIASKLYGNERKLKLVYRPFVSLENFKDSAKMIYEKNMENDFFHKTTTIGVHREDFRTFLDGDDIADFGSQGENRLAAISLKISPFFLIEDERKKPITILDDVYSELDYKHSQRLSTMIMNLGQTFITSANDSISGDALIYVSDNNAIRRK